MCCTLSDPLVHLVHNISGSRSLQLCHLSRCMTCFRSCKAVSPVPPPFSYNAAAGVPKSVNDLHPSLACPSCSVPLWGASSEAGLLSSLTQHFTLALRAAQKQHAVGWLVSTSVPLHAPLSFGQSDTHSDGVQFLDEPCVALLTVSMYLPY